MPKKKSGHNKGRVENGLDPLESASVASVASEESDAPTSLSNDFEDLAGVQSIVDRINAASEALMEKRLETRVKALNFLINCFRMHYLYLDESWNYSATLLGGIEYVLKKGRTQDQALAVDCLTVFFLQFISQNIQDYFARFWPILDTALRDTTVSTLLRAACATALSIFQLVAGQCDFVSSKELMKSFESVFKGSCLKGDGKAPVLDAHVSSLHVTTLRAWGILYTFLASYDVGPVGKAMLPTLISLLQGANVDLRITAGEVAVLIYERIRIEEDKRFRGPYYCELTRLLNGLSTDGTKSRSKIERRKQRHTFRELVDALEHSEVTETSINFGSECLQLGSCTEHMHYDLLCCLLKGGLSRHLQENSLVRDLFDLGPPVVLPTNPLDRRSARDQRRLANALASKLRTQKLSSHRDRRNVLAEID
ncbi:unnamed protein product [Dicrocoelium dendriticum]|nr:unnamed protein product [Dicrocoelium dendriticum]